MGIDDPNSELAFKGQCHEIFNFSGFFRESVSPKPLSIPSGPFQIFFLKYTKIFAAQGAPLVLLTRMTNGKKSSITKVLITLFGHLWVVELTYMYCTRRWNFFLQVHFKVYAVWDCSNYLPSMTPAIPVAKFSSDAVDTGDAPWLVNISRIFWKNLKWP